VDISLDAEVLKRIGESQDPNEIAQLCLKAGIASGELARDSIGNVVLNSKISSPVPKPRQIDFDNKETTEGANPRPEDLEFRK
jgi:hypothetical protein